MPKVGIIGGGPAGLAAAMALHRHGIAFELFEAGLPLHRRRHDCAGELGGGIGGAGLFSDGKFSFYPSGTHLYTLAGTDLLRRSYDAIAAATRRAGIEMPDFPELGWAPPGADGLARKDYHSSYGTLEQRKQLIGDLGGAFDGQITTGARIERIERCDRGYGLHYLKDGAIRPAGPFDSLILANGRFGAMALKAMIDDDLRFDEQRYEVGIRLEHPAHLGFLRKSDRPDVKILLRDSGVEIRTFCTCRRGEVWMIPYGEMAALSGRADGPPSNYCNFGLLPRFSGAQRAVGREIWEHYRAKFAHSPTALWQSLPEFLDGPRADIGSPDLADRPWNPRDAFAAGDIAGALHPRLRTVLRGSIRALIEHYPDLYSPDCICLFPAVEGVGSFPETDAHLQIPGERIWCCGDVAGRFRGLIPALVSGYYAGSSVATRHEGAADAAALRMRERA